MFSDRWPRWQRWLVLSFAGAGLTMVVFLTRLWWSVQGDPNDGMNGQALWWVFVDPFVMTVALPVAAISGLAAFGIARFWLDWTVMWKTATLMYGAVLAEILLVDSRDPFRALVFAYPTLLAAAIVSRLLFKGPPAQPPPPKD